MAEERLDEPQRYPVDTVDHRRILIVEDDEHLASILARWVRDHYQDNVEVRTAHSVEEGVTAIAELPKIDVVLLDRHFPEGRGDDLLDGLRDRFDPIIVMITGVEPESELIRLPVADYLVKPIDRADLVKRLALLDKLDTSGALSTYANARKASLLEYHLENPEGDPLFRRFAARWSYDRLEAAASPAGTFVYELYLQDESGGEPAVEVSIVGTLAEDLSSLVDAGDVVPLGELVPSNGGHAWIDIDRSEVIEPPEDGYVIYDFTGDAGDEPVRLQDVSGAAEIERELERAYA